MARFGYALGLKAASQLGVAGWRPGDEFEAARKKSQATTPIGSSLFDELPNLRVVHYEPVRYPPLARRTRIGGEVKLHVVVAKTGAVSEATIVSGHKLLVESARDNIRAWKFEPLATDQVEFDLIYEFIPGDGEEQRVSFTPQRIQIVVRGLLLNTQRVSGKKSAA
jgi:TonB family protein